MLFIHATIITMNARREIIGNGAIAIRDNRIVGIGKTPVLQQHYPDEEIIDNEQASILQLSGRRYRDVSCYFSSPGKK